MPSKHQQWKSSTYQAFFRDGQLHHEGQNQKHSAIEEQTIEKKELLSVMMRRTFRSPVQLIASRTAQRNGNIPSGWHIRGFRSATRLRSRCMPLCRGSKMTAAAHLSEVRVSRIMSKVSKGPSTDQQCRLSDTSTDCCRSFTVFLALVNSVRFFIANRASETSPNARWTVCW